jgi:hypothetical protein
MTEAEIRMAVHVAIVVDLDKLPQLKGKGKANAEQRLAHVDVFVGAVAEHFRKCVRMRPIEDGPVHSTTSGWRDLPARER